MAVDAFGLPIEFLLTGGDVHDAKEAPNLIATNIIQQFSATIPKQK